MTKARELLEYAKHLVFSEPDDDPLDKVQFHSTSDEEKALVAIEAIIAALC